MAFLKLLLLALVMAETCLDYGEAWGQPEREAIRNDHNDKRRNESACFMNGLVYSLDLEAQAKKWADECVYGHQDAGLGENIARFKSKKADKEIAIQGCEMWYSEIKDYNDTKTNCDNFCHYTQIVWADTKEIGCYLSDCVKFKFLVCFYYPPGNYEGEKHCIRKGNNPCREGGSMCREGQIEINKLCYDEDKKDQGDPATTTTPPPTTTTTTTTTPPPTTTTVRTTTTPKPTTTTTTTTTTPPPTTTTVRTTTTPPPTTTTTTTTPPPTTTTKATTTAPPPKTTTEKKSAAYDKCRDYNTRCPSYAAAGECVTDERYMKRNCKKSCNLCYADNDAQRNGTDRHAQTQSKANTTSSRTSTSSTGPVSQDVCENKSRYCRMWAKKGKCVTNPDFYGKNCRKACNLCSALSIVILFVFIVLIYNPYSRLSIMTTNRQCFTKKQFHSHATGERKQNSVFAKDG